MVKPYLIEEYINGKLIKIRKYTSNQGRYNALKVLLNTSRVLVVRNLGSQVVIERNRKREKRRKLRAFLREQSRFYKSVRGCKYCGSGDNLTYHHRIKKKSREDGKKATGNTCTSNLSMWREIYKCEVVCLTCHDKIHNEGMKELVDFHPYWTIVRM